MSGKSRITEKFLPVADTDAILQDVGSFLGRNVNKEEFDLIRSVTRRIAAETGTQDDLTSRDLYVAVRDAKRARGFGEYHYLTRLYSVLDLEDRRVLAATLLAISRTVNYLPIDAAAKLTPGAVSGWLDDVTMRAKYWPGFLDQLISPPEHLLFFGVHEFVTGAERTWDVMWRSGTMLIAPGENVDMRLSVLLHRVVELSEQVSLQGNAAVVRDAEIARVKAAMRMAADDEKALVSLYDDDVTFRQASNGLFDLLIERGDHETARHAAEVQLFLSRSDLYRRRAESPIGKPSANFPKTDGHNRDSVFALLKTLGFTAENEAQKDEVWAIWRASWDNTTVTVDDLLFDLDKTLYDWSVNWKHLTLEKIKLRDIVIAIAAKVLRDGKPVAFVTHSNASRVVEIVNHPNLALMRFILFARTPSDPAVSIEEITSRPNALTNESIAKGEVDVLKKFYDGGFDYESLTAKERRIVSMSLTDVESFFIEFLRGHKFPSLLATEQDGHARTHVDDTPGNIEVTAGAGMPAILAPLNQSGEKLDPSQRENSYVWNMLWGIDDLKTRPPGTVMDLRSAGPLIAGMPQAELHYDDYVARMFRGWGRPTIDLVGLKLKIWYGLWQRGDIGAYRKKFAATLAEEKTLKFRSELKRQQRYDASDPAVEFNRRIQPGLATRGRLSVTDAVDVSSNDGTLVLSGKSHDDKQGVRDSRFERFGSYGIIPKVVSKAVRLLLNRDEDGFNQLAATYGAELLDYLALRVDVKGLEKLDPNKAYVFAPTHGSEIDHIILYLVLKGYDVGFAAKPLFSKLPIIGQVMKLFPDRFVTLFRNDTAHDRAALGSTAHRAGASGVSFVIFPHGTRKSPRIGKDGKRIDGDLNDKGGLRSGIGYFAQEAGLDVVPITINGNGRAFPSGLGPVSLNDKISVVIGNPIEVATLPGESPEDKSDALIDALYDAYDRDTVVPHSDKATGKAWEALRKLDRAMEKGRLEVDLKTIERLLTKADPAFKTAGLTPQERAKARQDKQINDFRFGLDAFLDAFHAPFLAMTLNDDAAVREWCDVNGVSSEYFERFVKFLPQEEILGVFARAGHDLNRPAIENADDASRTWQFMRMQRTGWWLAKNILRRAWERFVTSGTPAEIKPGKIEYHDEAPADLSYDDAVSVYHERHADDARDAQALIEGQIALQSETFREQSWPVMSSRFEEATTGQRDSYRHYLAARSRVTHADYKPVADALVARDAAILTSGAMRGMDDDLRIFAFDTLAAKKDYEEALSAAPSDAERIARTRARFYRLWGEGSSLQVLNVYDAAVQNRAGAKRLSELKDLAALVSDAAECAARGESLEEALARVDGEIAELRKKMGVLALKQFKPMSASGTRYRELPEIRERLVALIRIRDESGCRSVDDLLEHLADGAYGIVNLRGHGELDAIVSRHDGIRSAMATVTATQESWEESAVVEASTLLAPRLEYYQKSFDAEVATNAADFEFQKSRYRDLASRLRAEKGMSREQESRFLQALSDYELKFAQYKKVSEELTHPEAKSSEPQRKKWELEVFFSWLRLHWAVADIAKESGSAIAGKIAPASAMFPNQTKILNAMSSREMEGLRPIFESMTFELLRDLYAEILGAAGDERKVLRIMGRWGFDAARRAASEVHVYGAKTFLGAVSQAVGIDLAEAGAGVFDPERLKRFGVTARAFGFSANHQGFMDYPAVSLLVSLAVRAGIVAEQDNFYGMPVLGDAMRHMDTPWTKRGITRLADVVPQTADRGASFVTFDHGTRRVATAPNPLASGPYAPFWSREYVVGGSRGEAATAAGVAHVPTIPMWQHFPANVDPDLGLTGNLKRGNFDLPWSIHNGTGAALSRPAYVSFSQPYPSWRMNDVITRAGGAAVLPGLKNLSPSQALRRANAATTEIGRMDAFTRTLPATNSVGLPSMSMMPRLPVAGRII